MRATDRRNRLGRDGTIMARFGDSSKTSEGERKASAAELLASIIEELRAGSVEPERVRELARAAAILLGGLPPPPELVEGLIRCGLRRIKDGAQMSNMREITGEMRTLFSSWIQYDSVKKARETRSGCIPQRFQSLA